MEGAGRVLPEQFQAELHLSPDRLRAAQFAERRIAHRRAGDTVRPPRSPQKSRRRTGKTEAQTPVAL